MKTLEATIKAARECAGATESMQVVGRVNGGWVYCNTEDENQRFIDTMEEPTFYVVEEGITDSAETVLLEMQIAGIEGDRDWDAGTTTYWVGDEAVVVCGNNATVRGRS